MNPDKNKIHAVLIIIVTIFFFPVGILLMIIRTAQNRGHSYKSAKDLKLWAYVCLALLFVFAAIYQSDDASGLFGFMFIAAIVLYIIGWSKQARLKSRLQIYYNLIVLQQEASIHRIAHQMQQRSAAVLSDVSYMFRQCMLPPGYIDMYQMMIVLHPPDFHGGAAGAYGYHVPAHGPIPPYGVPPMPPPAPDHWQGQGQWQGHGQNHWQGQDHGQWQGYGQGQGQWPGHSQGQQWHGQGHVQEQGQGQGQGYAQGNGQWSGYGAQQAPPAPMQQGQPPQHPHHPQHPQQLQPSQAVACPGCGAQIQAASPYEPQAACRYCGTLQQRPL